MSLPALSPSSPRPAATPVAPAELVWTEAHWQDLDQRARAAVLEAEPGEAAMRAVGRHAQEVIRAFSTSFFIVTRFLPPAKRLRVEVIYATVRYPDEIVDTFPLSSAEQEARLDAWAAAYEQGLAAGSIHEAVAAGVPTFLAGFTEVGRETGLPPEHYRAFLAAMRRDITARPFATLDELIADYIHGSAIVVGYFLTYVYGASGPAEFERALAAARRLAIGLQLTNFLRDVAEDHARGRLYLPLDALAAEGISRVDPDDCGRYPELCRVLRRLAGHAEQDYAFAAANLDAFAPDCHTAIRACIEVYRQLNQRVAENPDRVLDRATVPLLHKLRVLPASKYWRLPLAFLGLQESVEGLSAWR